MPLKTFTKIYKINEYEIRIVTMTAENYLDRELNGCYQKFTNDGITLISGIEHSEMCEIMENYAKHHLKQKVNSISDEDILKGAIQQDSMNEQLAWGEGAKWFKQKLLE